MRTVAQTQKVVVTVRLAHLAQTMYSTILADLAARKLPRSLKETCTNCLSSTWDRRPLCFSLAGFSGDALDCIDLLEEMWRELESINPKFTSKFILSIDSMFLRQVPRLVDTYHSDLISTAEILGLS